MRNAIFAFVVIFLLLSSLFFFLSIRSRLNQETLPLQLVKKSEGIEQIIKAEAFEIKELPKGQKYAYYKTVLNLLSFEEACETHKGSKGFQVSFTDKEAEKERVRVYWVHCSQDSIYQSQAEIIFFEGVQDTVYLTKKYREDWQMEGLPEKTLSREGIIAGQDLLETISDLKRRWRPH